MIHFFFAKCSFLLENTAVPLGGDHQRGLHPCDMIHVTALGEGLAVGIAAQLSLLERMEACFVVFWLSLI